MGRPKEYTEEDCLDAMKRAVEEFGESVTMKEYQTLDDVPSIWVLKNRFGSWKKVKAEAGFGSLLKKERRRRAAKIWLYKRKQEAECVACGETDPRTLDFHHESEKGAPITEMVRDAVSLGEIVKESKRCVILCSNCHRREHNRWPPLFIERCTNL